MTAHAGQRAPTTVSTDRYDVPHFAVWLVSEGIDLVQPDPAAFTRYSKHVQNTYAKSTASRIWVPSNFKLRGFTES